MKKETTVPKRSVGRPTKVEFSKRAYLVKSEIELAMTDKYSFIELLENDEVDKNHSVKSNELHFTIQGPILNVITELHKIRAFYGSKVKLKMSKEKNSDGVSYSTTSCYGFATIKLN